MDNTGYTPEEPIASVATSLAPAALGIIRTSGKNTIELLSKIFSRPEALKNAPGNTIVYGWIVDSQNIKSQEAKNLNEKERLQKIDEVLVSVFRAPKSFTGEEMAEISCHGGTAVVTKILNLLLRSGFRQAERGEFTFRAFLNGKTDLTKAEAVREIIDSRTGVSSQKAAGRLAGGLAEEIASVKKLIVDTLAQIEVEIEYPEDEETIADAYDKKNLETAASALAALASSWKSEKLYQEGARIVLAGKTNAGKSSLFNALLKEDRAIVSDIEGTTRDWIESWISIDGIPARLFDTAGLRKTDDKIELAGLVSTKELSDEADLILYLADASLSGDETESIDTDFLAARKEPVIFVWNKIDKIGADAKKPEDNLNADADFLQKERAGGFNTGTPSLSKGIAARAVVSVSARTGLGIKSLVHEIKKVLLAGQETERVQAGLGSERQKLLITAALESIRHALSLDTGYSLDATVQDLEDALDALGELTGEVTADDVLESIFSHFCVGK